jgi:hypothetical protein
MEGGLMVIINFIGKLSAATDRVQTLPFSFTKVIIEPSSFRTFSISAIALISIFSSMIVSIVEKGNVKAGLKYIPIYLFGSLTFYFIFMKILGAIFGNIA